MLATLALAPLVIVGAGDTVDAAVAGYWQRRLTESAALAAASEAEVSTAANAATARVWRLDAGGAVIAEADREGRGDPWQRAQAAIFGALPAGGGPDPVLVAAARAGIPVARCTAAGALMVCEAASPGPGGAVAVARRQVRRGPVALADISGTVVQASALALVLAIGLGSWLAVVWLRPIRRLEAAALARAGDPLRAAPIETDRLGELTDLAEAFNALLAEVRSRAEANEAFTADLVHELKSPVAAIRATAETLSDHPPTDPARLARHAAVLSTSAARLDALLGRFLAIARAEAGLQADARESVDLRALVARLGEGAELALADARVTASPVALEGAVRNLLDNARAFARGRVRARLEVEGGAAVLTVDDDGPGVPDDIGARVFDRFFTTRGGGRGTGLGLALVKAIAEAHGGSVAVARSDDLGGASFTLSLPLA